MKHQSKLRCLVAAGATLASVVALSAAHAQGYLAPTFEILKPTIPELVAVSERPRPEYDALGIKVGAFTWYPSAAATVSYDDNVYSVKSNRLGDWVGKVRPEIKVKSNWSNHAFEAYGMVEGVGYDTYGSEDRTNGRVDINGSIDVTRDTRIRYFGNWVHESEDRSITSLFNAVAVGLTDKPIEYDTLTGGVGVDQKFNQFSVSASGTYVNSRYQDGTLGPVIVDQSFRNLNSYAGRLRLGYDVSPKTKVYVEGGYERREYELNTFNSDSYRLVGGVAGNITPLITGDVYTGYQQRAYDLNAINTINDWTYGGALTWFATPLFTVGVYGERSINESTFGNTGSFIQSRIGTRMDYEAMRNLILTGRVGYEWDDYDASTRSDNVLSAGLTAMYLMNKNLSLALDYRFTERTSNFNALNYSRDVVGATVRVQY